MKPDTPETSPSATPSEPLSAGSTAPAAMPEHPEDALSRTPEDLAEEATEKAAASIDLDTLSETSVKQPSKVKQFLRKINVYFLIFILVVVIGAATTIVNYLNSQKETPPPSLATQDLDEDALKQLSNRDASVGTTSQTLTIKGNAIIEGETLMRGDLNVAGNFQTGGTIQGSSVTVSGAANLGATQVQSLQVQANAAVQGSTTLRDVTVSGTSSFSGPATMSQLSVTRLIMSGNANLEVPNHISFSGPSPSRSISPAALGAGGSASVSGSDTSGTINISTGNNPVAGCFTRITFNRAFSSQPRVIISPINSAAGQTDYYVTRDNNGFSVCTANPAPRNQAFGFDYFVAGS